MHHRTLLSPTSRVSPLLGVLVAKTSRHRRVFSGQYQIVFLLVPILVDLHRYYVMLVLDLYGYFFGTSMLPRGVTVLVRRRGNRRPTRSTIAVVREVSARGVRSGAKSRGRKVGRFSIRRVLVDTTGYLRDAQYLM